MSGLLAAGLATGLSGLSGNLLTLYKMKQDGNFRAQQELLSQLREEEAVNAHSRAIHLDARNAMVRRSEAVAEKTYEIERDWRQAQIAIQVRAVQERMDREVAESPFRYRQDELYELVHDATAGGASPALLVAPFVRDDLSGQQNDEGPHSFRYAIRQAWIQSQWAGDLVSLDGVINRPLRNTDLDILLIQRALRNLPVILVYGRVQSNRRVWPSLCAWNVVDSPEMRSIQFTFPPLSIPDPGSVGQPAQLVFEDELGTTTAISAGLIAEWFHLVRYGRAPRLHTLLAPELIGERRVIAVGLAASYEVAIETGRMDGIAGRVGQAEMFQAAGLSDQAEAAAVQGLLFAEDVLRDPACRPSPASLRSLVSIFESLGRPADRDRARVALESAARRSILHNLGWRNR
ncbi:hypothetical protein ACFVZ8_18935 [Streptomyces sp. NPDC059558]|uniref:hypothetical protein n=1 Tax=Streptomyces sp. NPDC059558 TaxID=3346864 RepID=UPI00369D4FAC